MHVKEVIFYLVLNHTIVIWHHALGVSQLNFCNLCYQSVLIVRQGGKQEYSEKHRIGQLEGLSRIKRTIKI